jgi:exonuclease SbcC
MIISKIRLENFKKYRSFEMEFSEGLIGIIGKNGSGKSTIFEAIFFALYGELRHKGYKEIVKNSNADPKDALLVELEFEFDAVSYKAVREFRGKTLNASAKLYKNGTLVSSGSKEVGAFVRGLTKMSKEAFIHTIFASQKELSSLSALKNEDRKKMIRRLLGLEKIDSVENSLVEKSRELKREISAFSELLLGESEVKIKEDLLRERAASKEAMQKDFKSKSKDVEDLKLQEQNIKKELENFAKTKDEKQKLSAELELIKNSKSMEILNQVKLSAELHELEHKAKKFEELSYIKKEYETLQERLREQDMLRENHLKKDGLQKEQTILREQYAKSKTDIIALEKECRAYDEFVLNAKNIEINSAVLQDSIKSKRTIENELLAEILSEQKQIDLINEKIEKLHSLGSESACPTCTRPLLEEYDNVVNSLSVIAKETHQKKIDDYKKQLQNVRNQKEIFEKEKEVKEKELLELTKNINIIQSKLQDLKKEREYFAFIEQKGIKNRDELEVLEKFIYNEELHKEIKNSALDLEPKHKHLLTLETELKRVAALRSDLANTDHKIEELKSKRQNKEKEFNRVIYDEAKHKQKLQEHDEALKVIDVKTATLNEINIEIAKIDGEIKILQNTIQNNDVHLKKVQCKKEDLKDYEKIKLSLFEFKTKLNEKISPRISEIASDMFVQITKGKYQQIEVDSDFDFFIYDEGKKYPIERFSGGEIDLANLVLRIAISRTLRELSGASNIGFLAFDEVFGSQDEARRMEILEAFHTIKEQYRQIFLISHESEIKEMFERVVEL